MNGESIHTKELATSGETRKLHAEPNNSGIATKFSENFAQARRLNMQEWLNEADIQNFLEALGVQGVKVLSSADDSVGSALRLIREDQAGATQPYIVPMILNFGENDQDKKASQGTHWVYVTASVDPVKKEISFELTDSVNTSAKTNADRQEILKAAANYKESAIVDGVYEETIAFSDYKVEIAFKNTNTQKESWTCGYRAVHGLLKECYASGASIQTVPPGKQEKLRQFINAEPTAENLRDQIYDALLEAKGLSLISSSPRRIQSASASPAVVHTAVASPAPASSPAPVASPAPTQPAPINFEALAIDDFTLQQNTAEQLDRLRNSENGIIETKESRTSIDFANLFPSASEALVVQRAKIKALVQFLNAEKITNLEIINSDSLPQALEAFAVEEFEKMLHVVAVSADSEFEHQCDLIAGRNALIKHLELRIDPNEAIWPQICAQRIADVNFFREFNFAYKDKLYLWNHPAQNTDGSVTAFSVQLNHILSRISSKYFENILSYIESEKIFFAEKDFEYPVLMLNDEEDSKKITEQLHILLTHLQEGKHFPFKALEIYAPFDNAEILGEILSALSTYPHFENATVTFPKSTPEPTPKSTDEKEYDLTLFENTLRSNPIFFNLNLRITEESKPNMKQRSQCQQDNKTMIDANLSFENISASNRRVRNSAKLKQRNAQPVKQEEDRSVLPRRGTIFELRPYNPAEIEYEAELVVEQQTETEVQAEVQTQAEAAPSSAFMADDLIDKARYEKDQDGFDDTNFIMAKATSVKSYDYITDKGRAFDQADTKSLFWDRLAGASGLAHSVKYLTRAALNQCRQFPQHFYNGLNIDNLPQGFSVVPFQHPTDASKNGLVLSYKAVRFSENKNESPLTLYLEEDYTSMGPAFRGDLKQFLPVVASNNKVKAVNELSMQDIEYFFGLTPNKVREDEPLSKFDEKQENFFKFINLVAGKSGKASVKDLTQKYNSLLKNMETFTSRALSFFSSIIYYAELESLEMCLDVLNNLKTNHPKIYVLFKNNFLDANAFSLNEQNILNILSPKSLGYLVEISNLKPEEARWWWTLVGNENKYKAELDLIKLFEAFKYFLSKLPEGVSLPRECPLAGPNGLVSLDRILFILLGKPGTNRSVDDIMEQLQNLQGFTVEPEESQKSKSKLKKLEGPSFGPEGAWYAARWDGLHFVHPDMLLSPEFLSSNGGKDGLPTSYKVNYADLVALSADTAIDLPRKQAAALFYRYIAQNPKMDRPFAKYITLADKFLNLTEKLPKISIKTLTLLALSTTNPGRGHSAEIEDAFLNLIKTQLDHSKSAQLSKILDALIQLFPPSFGSLTPTLPELTSILTLMTEVMENDENLDPATIFKGFTLPLSTRMLTHFTEWYAHPHRLPAKDFMRFLQEFQKHDPEHLDEWVTILVKTQTENSEISEVEQEFIINIISTSKSEKAYSEIIKIIATLDVENTPPGILPNLFEVVLGLKESLSYAKDPSSNAMGSVQKAFEGCKFGYIAAPVPIIIHTKNEGLDTLFEGYQAELALLEGLGLAPLDLAKLKGQGQEPLRYLLDYYKKLIDTGLAHAFKNLQKQLKEGAETKVSIQEKYGAYLGNQQSKIMGILTGPEFIGLSAISFVKGSLNSGFFELLSKHYLNKLQAQAKKLDPEVGAKIYELYPIPNIEKFTFENMEENFFTLQNYTNVMEDLFSVTARLRSRYSKKGFDANAIFPAVATHFDRFGKGYDQVVQITQILEAVDEQDFSVFPQKILESIFMNPGASSALEPERLRSQIIRIVQLENFTELEKADLIGHLYATTPNQLNDFNNLVEVLNLIKTNYSLTLVEKMGRLMLDAYQNKKVDVIFKETKALFALLGQSNPVNPLLTLIFESLDGNLKGYTTLLNSLTLIPAEQKNSFLKMIAYAQVWH